jgi:hypothetical protein
MTSGKGTRCPALGSVHSTSHTRSALLLQHSVFMLCNSRTDVMKSAPSWCQEKAPIAQRLVVCTVCLTLARPYFFSIQSPCYVTAEQMSWRVPLHDVRKRHAYQQRKYGLQPRFPSWRQKARIPRKTAWITTNANLLTANTKLLPAV